jgi:hypothetical protein
MVPSSPFLTPAKTEQKEMMNALLRQAAYVVVATGEDHQADVEKQKHMLAQKEQLRNVEMEKKIEAAAKLQISMMDLESTPKLRHRSFSRSLQLTDFSRSKKQSQKMEEADSALGNTLSFAATYSPTSSPTTPPPSQSRSPTPTPTLAPSSCPTATPPPPTLCPTSIPTIRQTRSKMQERMAELLAQAEGASRHVNKAPLLITLVGKETDIAYVVDKSKDFADCYMDPGATCTHTAFGTKLRIPYVPATIKLIKPGVHRITYTCADPENNSFKAVPVTRTVITKIGAAPTDAPTSASGKFSASHGE